jgi:hypothetical protein
VWVLKRARELQAEGDPRSVRGVVQDAIAVHGQQADLLWALADAEFAHGDLIMGRYLDEAVAAGRGNPASVARQVRGLSHRQGLRLGGFWREALSIGQGCPPELRADPWSAPRREASIRASWRAFLRFRRARLPAAESRYNTAGDSQA